ncbi:MAG: Histidine--tRNA ligase [Bacteroidetes bacterium ADurb.Bin234]|jgi:histidyl-tRNA synthetase|nr:MAG: Histidine--tRNA ligase [Bacteroidetes bacterium ADurb.Bin234]
MGKSVSIPKGTRDFLPFEMNRRNYIFNTIREVFETYGYVAIETPAMENLSTLLGKYGEEGDKLLFKILNSGDFMAKADPNETNLNKWITVLCEKGLRYDLTVPFARFVVQHREEITLPFKRYQMQAVWRADKPQKGRYREFFQCDVDVIGSKSMLNEVELIQIEDDVFSRFGIHVAIKLNNRKILSGIAQYIDAEDKIVDITVAIDKLDKIGLENVKNELITKGLSSEAIAKLQPVFDLSGSNEEKLSSLKNMLAFSETAMQGIKEMEEIFTHLSYLTLNNPVELDLTLARGLNYYTGAIIEVKAREHAYGSLSGGGRYDNLTGIFGIPDMSGVGISFGADRIYDVLNETNAFPEMLHSNLQALFVNFGAAETQYLLPILRELRAAGLKVMLYPDAVKIGKQFTYANNLHIPYVVVAGEEEIKNHKLQVKNMQSGEQQMLDSTELLALLKHKQ